MMGLLIRSTVCFSLADDAPKLGETEANGSFPADLTGFVAPHPPHRAVHDKAPHPLLNCFTLDRRLTPMNFYGLLS